MSDEKFLKTVYAIVGILCLTVLQIIAWSKGFDGVVFATTSGLIGLISGSILGFTWKPQE